VILATVRRRAGVLPVRSYFGAGAPGVTVEVSGHSPCDVDAVTDGVAFGGLDVVAVPPVGGPDIADGGAVPMLAVITPIVMRTPAPTAAAPTLKIRFLCSEPVT
jgi:hypothetical protein